MTISLSPDLADLIRRRVDSGPYSSADEVVRESLALLEERDKLARLRVAIAVGDAQFARGEGIAWTPDSMDRLDEEVDERLRRGEQPNPDVCPSPPAHPGSRRAA